MLMLSEIREKFAEIEEQHVAGVMAAYNKGMEAAWDAAQRLVCEHTLAEVLAMWPDNDGYEDVIANHTAEEVIDKLAEAQVPCPQVGDELRYPGTDVKGIVVGIDDNGALRVIDAKGVMFTAAPDWQKRWELTGRKFQGVADALRDVGDVRDADVVEER